ncbi:LytTR family DNA-binding domain-containing protein [Massilia sp. ZL223]|uniref:LytR/AlgR family response regulator transcription factor n=1 Tax=Massilia sp. ZL223 TaxID=2824904 RepID=UPI001B81D2AB|nr:LytTR family DNA-binding domain-containing protein [Massilia sp. ZL223]MBQ5964306.1 response regulator transcription factor [Massilia sp. ZL223]
MNAPRILIADDEPLLRADLAEALGRLWPEAQVVAMAGDGIEAIRLAHATGPDAAFLDIRMPGLSGLEVARTFSHRTHVVFVTAHEEHALAAFDEGALDYVLKPIDPARLARAIERLRGRLHLPPPDLGRALQALNPRTTAPSWIQASVGSTIHFIDLADVAYFSSELKYTRVVTDQLEAHIRTPLRELAETLEPSGFWQIHRSHLVNVKRIASVRRDEDGAMWLQLRGMSTRLPVSQRYQARFRGM